MTLKPVRIQVLVHDLELTGVPIALERTLEWVEHFAGHVTIDVVAEHDGPRRERLAALASSLTTMEPRSGRSTAASLAAGTTQLGANRLGDKVRAAAWRRLLRGSPEPDIVVVYGAGAWALWHAVARPTARLVIHLHELEFALTRCMPSAALPTFLSRADTIMAVSEPVADVARSAGVAHDRIVVVPGAGIALQPIPRPAPDQAQARTAFSIGTPGWRKGTDRAIAIAYELRRSHPEVIYRWIGGAPDGDRAWADLADLPILWHAPVDDPWSVAGQPAVLVVPSREDPLPLVVLEAGAREIPVVATATGGLPDLLAGDCGLTVPDGDLTGLVSAVRSCLDDPERAQRRARALRAHIGREFDPVDVAGRWWRAVLGSDGPRSHP